MAGSLTPSDYADLNMGQAEAVLGANNVPDFNAGVTVLMVLRRCRSFPCNNFQWHRAKCRPRHRCVCHEAVQILDDEAGSIGEFAGSCDLDQALWKTQA